jgi:signal transduction histidine kinase
MRSSYRVVPQYLPFLEEIASSQSTPFTLLAEALLQDETAAVLGQHQLSAFAQTEGAAAATTRHARMVAHEIRNALVPVQSTVRELFRDLERSGVGDVIEPHRVTIDEGIERIFRFVKTMVSVAALGAEPAEPFDIVPAIEDAIAALAPETGLKVVFHREEDLPSLLGRRDRFTLVIANLIRNAAQARPGGQIQVEIHATAEAARAEIATTVDDDGPGVPPENRERIFERGFSTRAGGTGEGLALVREVVEGEMGGKVSCEDSPMGGARFLLRLPVRRGGTRG